MNSSDLASIASLATAGGTLVLAVATFAAVRSANRAARAAEQSLLVGLRPLLVPSRLQDETQKVMFGDGKWLQIPGGRATLHPVEGGDHSFRVRGARMPDDEIGRALAGPAAEFMHSAQRSVR